MRSTQYSEPADQGCGDAQLLLSRHKSPTVFRNVEADGVSNELRVSIQIRGKFAMAECHRQHAASVRSPDFHSAQTAATGRFPPASLLFVMRCGRPAVRANAGVLRNVARPEFASAP